MRTILESSYMPRIPKLQGGGVMPRIPLLQGGEVLLL